MLLTSRKKVRDYTFCELSPGCERLIERAMTQPGLSGLALRRYPQSRPHHIADLEDAANRELKHTGDAIQYGSLDPPHGA
jgi:hypothetical protein